MKRLGLSMALCLGLLAAPLPASAEDPTNGDLVCEAPPTEIDSYRYLRALSLDLRGELPSPTELDEVTKTNSVPEPLIDGWLRSDAFAERMVRLHRDLLWNNVNDVRLASVRAFLSSPGGIWSRGGTQAIRYRGANVRCLNEAARFDENGQILFTDMADGSRREGWVMVAPYWAPDTQIRVCALDAQEALISPSNTDCRTNAGFNDTDCGCGPNLRTCMTGANQNLIRAALAEDVDRRIAKVIREDRPYIELFTGQTGHFNGPLAHYWRYQRGVPGLAIEPAPVPVDQMPDLPFTAVDTWVEIDMGPQHAGILTSVAYMMRFQTNRARANRFYNAFLCQPFNSPSGGLPVADESSQTEPDLQVRAGCEYCHALLEPAAAHWGRWGERGATYLNPVAYPAFDDGCELCATSGLPCSARCRTFYKTDTIDAKEEGYIGWLNSFVFRRDEHMLFVDEGPRLLVYNTIVDGRLPKCIARKAAEHLLGRPVGHDEDDFIDDLANDFVASGYRYSEMFKSILTHPTYRRVR